MTDCNTASGVRCAIVDFGLGNLFSIKSACASVSMNADIVDTAAAIAGADMVILPGVGAFGDAMRALSRKDLVRPLLDFAASGRPLVGICLGMQLLMEESAEFGRHRGLGLLKGVVKPFREPSYQGKILKVPHVGWNAVASPQDTSHQWSNSPLSGLVDGVNMYFTHSFVVQPADHEVVLSESCYGHIRFCSSLQHGSVFGFQFHPERSGASGLRIYANLAETARLSKEALPCLQR